MSTELKASLKLAIAQTGLDNITGLIHEMEAAGVATEEFETHAAELSAELARIARERSAVEQFRALKEASTESAKAMQAAASATTESAKALRARQSELAQLTTAEHAAAEAVAAARTRHAELAGVVQGAATELKQLREAAKSSGEATGEYASKIAETQTRLKTLRTDAKTAAASVTELAAAHKAAVAATREANDGVSSAEKTFTRVREEAGRTKTAFEEQRLALHNNRKALAEAGIDTARLAEHQRTLATAQRDTTARVQELAQTLANAGGSTEALSEGLQEVAKDLANVDVRADQLHVKLTRVAGALGALFAGAGLKTIATNAIDVADAYGQMASRIEMATNSSEEYAQVQQRLLATASATYRPLAEAQELYIRAADALRSLGYETSAALDITDSLSYLLVTNAASADKAASAIDAYSKALQAGKIDGDGWVSILTAMPTVTDALAAATGKSTAEIRRLGMEGKLAIHDLNEALRQSVEANQALAASMPTTVADAVQALANSWSAYIGEANRASGATDVIVRSIELVAENLESLISLSLKAGEVMLAAFGARALMAVKAYAAAQLASIRTTQQATGAALAQATALQTTASALDEVTAATARNAAATRTATTASGGYLAALGKLRGIGSALKFTGWMAAATAVMELGQRLLFAKSAAEEAEEALSNAVAAADFSDREGLLAFEAALREVGETAELTGAQIEEALGKRFRKLSQEDLEELRHQLVIAFEDGANSTGPLAAVLAQVDDRLADIAERAGWMKPVLDEAEAARFQLSEIQKLFQAIGSDAQGAASSAAEALSRMLDSANIDSVDGIRQLAEDLKEVQASAYAADEEIDRGLRQRLAQLSGKELQEFRIQADMALGGVAESALQLARINEQVLLASFDKLGVNAAAALGKISPAAQNAIDSLDVMVASLAEAEVGATESAAAIEMALSQAFDTADSLPAIAALEARMRGLAEAGLLGASGLQRLEGAAKEARSKIEALLPGVQSIEEAFKNLGIQSQAELDQLAATAKESFDKIKESGKATPRELSEAFKAYAASAIEANDGVATAALKAEAAQHGLKIEADESGKAIVKSMKEAAEATKEVADNSDEAAQKLGEVANEVRDLVSEARDHNASIGGITQSWITAEVAASRYAKGAAEAGRREFERWGNHRKALEHARAAALGYVGAMEAMDAQQQRMSSNGVRGLEDLQQRWLELNGTEAEVAKARQQRERLQYERELASLQLAAKRATAEGNSAEAARLNDEVRLMREQLVLLDKIHRKEEANRAATERERAAAEREREREARNAERRRQREEAEASQPAPTDAAPTQFSPAPVHIHIAGVLDVNDPATLDSLGRKLKPVFADLTRRGV